jgi:hypothetical protein
MPRTAPKGPWCQQTIATSDTEIAGRSQQELRALDRRQNERRRGEEFSRYAFQAYTDTLPE